jgi:hypothetical protein
MADYQQEIVFKPSPTPPAAAAEPNEAVRAASGPIVQINPTDTNLPSDVNILGGISPAADANRPAEANRPVEANLPAEVK